MDSKFDDGSSTVTHDRLGMGVKGKTWYGICDGRVRGVAVTNEDRGIRILEDEDDEDDEDTDGTSISMEAKRKKKRYIHGMYR